MGDSLLITRPEYDPTTYYLSKWGEKIIKEAKAKRMNVIDLWRDKANRNRVIGILEKRDPKLVFFNGHGSENFIYGHNNEIILKENDKKAVNSKIIFSRSCRSAMVLGQNVIY